MTKQTKGLFIVLIMALCVTADAAEPPVGAHNVWVIAAENIESHSVGGGAWTQSASKRANDLAAIFHAGGVASLPVPNLTTSLVLVNQTAQSLPPASPGKAPVSLMGFAGSASIFSAQAALQVKASAGGKSLRSGDRVNTTIVLEMSAQPVGNTHVTDLALQWRVNGNKSERVQGKAAVSQTHYIAQNGIYTIEVQALRAGEVGEKQTWVLEIANIRPDTETFDADGIPDMAEIEFGLDMQGNDLLADKDNNGKSDFLDALCERHAQLGMGALRDSDEDGVSDCEEILYRTDPYDVQTVYADKPVLLATDDEARGLFQRNVLLNARVKGEPVEQNGKSLSRISAITMDDQWRYDSEALPTEKDLQASALFESMLPSRFQRVKVQDQLQRGEAPLDWRLPLGQGQIIYASDVTGWNARAWLGARAPLEPKIVTPQLVRNGSHWDSGAAWLADYGEYLLVHLTENVELTLSPQSSLALEIMDNLLRRFGEDQAILGNPDVPVPEEGIAYLENYVDDSGADWHSLMSELEEAAYEGLGAADLETHIEHFLPLEVLHESE